jgi:ribosomal protein L37AE/L43A
MLEELRAIDLADADRDENARKCDHCERPGRRWFHGSWLCDGCYERAEASLYEEAFGGRN